MIKYFKELLETLKRIEQHLATIAENSNDLAKCVKKSSRDYGDDYSLSTKHWNG